MNPKYVHERVMDIALKRAKMEGGIMGGDRVLGAAKATLKKVVNTLVKYTVKAITIGGEQWIMAADEAVKSVKLAIGRIQAALQPGEQYVMPEELEYTGLKNLHKTQPELANKVWRSIKDIFPKIITKGAFSHIPVGEFIEPVVGLPLKHNKRRKMSADAEGVLSMLLHTPSMIKPLYGVIRTDSILPSGKHAKKPLSSKTEAARFKAASEEVLSIATVMATAITPAEIGKITKIIKEHGYTPSGKVVQPKVYYAKTETARSAQRQRRLAKEEYPWPPDPALRAAQAQLKGTPYSRYVKALMTPGQKYRVAAAKNKVKGKKDTLYRQWKIEGNGLD